MPNQSILNKKVAVIIAFRDFRDVEYFIPKNILAGAGAKIITVSSQKGIAIGADGGEVQVNLLASEVNIAEFDAVVFIGGAGMGKSLDNPDFQKIAQDAAAADKVLGAICIAPALLAKAGVLKGKKATVWSSAMDKSAVKILEEGGAQYLAEDAVTDGKLITASGPPAAKQFGETLLELLTSF